MKNANVIFIFCMGLTLFSNSVLAEQYPAGSEQEAGETSPPVAASPASHWSSPSAPSAPSSPPSSVSSASPVVSVDAASLGNDQNTLHPSVMLRELQYRDRMRNAPFAGFIDAVVPVIAGSGCFYARRHIAGVFMLLGSLGTAGMMGYGIYGLLKKKEVEESSGVNTTNLVLTLVGACSYLLFRCLGISLAISGAQAYNIRLRKELSLPGIPRQFLEQLAAFRHGRGR